MVALKSDTQREGCDHMSSREIAWGRAVLNNQSHRLLLISGGVLFLLASLYGLMGFFQAVMLFTGERALKNSNIWSSVFLVCIAVSARCFAARRPTPALPPPPAPAP